MSLFFVFLKNFLFIHERNRERERHRQREKQAPRREPDAGLNPGTPGPRPGPKARAKPLSHPGIPRVFVNTISGIIFYKALNLKSETRK